MSKGILSLEALFGQRHGGDRQIWSKAFDVCVPESCLANLRICRWTSILSEDEVSLDRQHTHVLVGALSVAPPIKICSE